jgi:hypothetical protein
MKARETGPGYPVHEGGRDNTRGEDISGKLTVPEVFQRRLDPWVEERVTSEKNKSPLPGALEEINGKEEFLPTHIQDAPGAVLTHL